MSPKKKARLNDTNNPLNATESVLTSYEQVSKSTSQLSSQSNSQGSDLYKTNSQSASLSSSRNYKPSSLKKATFKIDSQILDSLDHYHLQLQIDLGKQNAPFKETIVELALKNILHKAHTDPEDLLKLLKQQQETRS